MLGPQEEKLHSVALKQRRKTLTHVCVHMCVRTCIGILHAEMGVAMVWPWCVGVAYH